VPAAQSQPKQKQQKRQKKAVMGLFKRLGVTSYEMQLLLTAQGRPATSCAINARSEIRGARGRGRGRIWPPPAPWVQGWAGVG
jgi:hypothetical protein